MILLSLIVFFGGVIFGGKFFATNDNISWLSFLPYLDHMEQTGQHPFWIPYIFSGMPAYAAYMVTGDRWWDLSMKILGMTEHVFAFTNYWTLRVIFHYFLYGTGMYLLMRSKKAARSTSLFVSLAAIFSTWIIVYIMIGHNTKISVLMTFPFLFICLEKLMKRWSLLYAGLLILVVHLMTEAAHPQTTLYGAFAVGIYLLFELAGGLLAKEKGTVASIARVGAVLVVAAGFAYGMGLDRYLALQEYTPYSTRGSASIVADKQEQDEAGHGYDYATNFSFSPEEVITFINPSYYGFGGETEYSGPATGNQPQRIRTYFGQMPFTDAAHYAGIAVLILGVFGAWMNRRNRFVQAMIVVGLFGLVLSFGKNMPLLYDLFYNFFPGFNRLRAPSQSLILLEFVFPILAGFGIETLIAMHKSGDNPEADKTILYTGYAFVGVCALGLLSAVLSKSSYLDSIAKSPLGQYPPEIREFIYSSMQSDWLIAAIFGAVTIALMYMYVKRSISPTLFKVALLIVLIGDLWRVAYRPMNTAVPINEAFAVFNPTDIDMFLKQDTSNYRILDVTQQPNYAARQFHQNIIGYSSAKMRVYQDLLDVAGDGNTPTALLAWNLLNTKYIIADQPPAPNAQQVFQSTQKKAAVYLNPDAMPRAWFVNRVEVAEPKATLEMIRDNKFNPRDVAYVTKPLAAKIDPVAAAPAAPADTTAGADSTRPAVPAPVTAGGGSVKFTSYDANRFTLDVEAPGNNFLVVSEVYYPASWRATIDGKPADIVQTNYVLRGLVVPPGKHTIEMYFESQGFETGKYASLGLNLVMFAIIGVGIVINRRRPEDADPTHDAPLIEEDDV